MKKNEKKFNNNSGLSSRKIAVEILLEIIESLVPLDDVFNKLPYTDEKREFTYFRMEDFYNFCKRNHWEVDKTKTGNLLKRLTIKEGYSEDIFVEEERVRIKKQQPRLIKIKTMKQTEASASKVAYQQEDF